MSQRQSACEPPKFADPRIIRACRFCGEREHLHLDEGAFERVQVVDGKVIEMVWLDNVHLEGAEYVDSVTCHVCDTIAALDVWNGTRPASDYAVLRDFEPAARVQAVAA
jgi:hypothetical protein